MMKLKGNTAASLKAQTIREEVIGGGKLTYLLTKKDITIEDVPVCVYGLSIISTLFGEPEIASFDDVSSVFERVEEIYETLVRNTVLPCTLKDILADCMQCYSC